MTSHIKFTVISSTIKGTEYICKYKLKLININLKYFEY